MLKSALLVLVLGFVAASQASALEVDRTKFKGLPRMVCANLKTVDLCKDQAALPEHAGKPGQKPPPEGGAARGGLPLGANLPFIACELPGSGGPCSTTSCGDGICAFGEAGQCVDDCPLPAKVDICACEKGPCTGWHIECDTSGCTTTKTTPTADTCTCKAPNGSQTCKAGETNGRVLCRVTRFEAPIETCELTRYKYAESGSDVRVERCSDLDCAPTSGLGLTGQLDENIQKTKIGGSR